jgi:hypothetical protein
MLLGAVNATFDDDLDMDKFQAINAALDTSGLQKSNTLSYSGGFRRGSSSFETNSNTIPTVSNDGRPSPEISRETPILEIPRNNLLLANQFSDSGHSSSSPWSSAIMSAANPISSHSSLEARIIRKAVTNNLQPVDNRSEDIDTGINSVPSDASDGFSLHDTIPTSLTLTRVREIAIKHIVREFTKDAELAVLFSDALARMPKDRFIRNNQRLLKSYFMNFRTQDKTVQERQAIRLLRGSEQRKSLAEETCIVLDTSQDLTKVERDALQEIDRLLEPAPDDAALLPDDDSDIQSHSGDDGDDTDESFTASLSNLERLVTFLMSGPPFLTYKSSLRDMLAKPKEIKIRSEEEALQINESSPQLVEKANLELGSNPDIEAESQAIAEMREGTPILDTTIDADQVINNSASRHCADHPEMIRPSKAAILDHENGYRILWRCVSIPNTAN